MHFSVFHMYVFISKFGLSKIQKCIITIIERTNIAKAPAVFRVLRSQSKRKHSQNYLRNYRDNNFTPYYLLIWELKLHNVSYHILRNKTSDTISCAQSLATTDTFN